MQIKIYIDVYFTYGYNWGKPRKLNRVQLHLLVLSIWNKIHSHKMQIHFWKSSNSK